MLQCIFRKFSIFIIHLILELSYKLDYLFLLINIFTKHKLTQDYTRDHWGNKTPSYFVNEEKIQIVMDE